MTFNCPKTYQVVSTESLDDIHATGYVLKHLKSGARLMLVPCSDNNKVFSIGFRTPPTDSTGVAHIIEHSVLCGSKNFPLKDPFVELVSGTLNTFLNAMTYPDKTIYPVASTNAIDFRNLMHVYMDAVLYPNIYRNDKIFKQEGWSYRLDNPDSPLTYNGVVYNEMKGAFSSPDEVVGRETMSALFPDTTYGVESGGDPQVIPQLTYENFLAFHKRYYHPSNSYIYLYGDFDVLDTLNWLDEQYLADFTAQAIDSQIPVQAGFSQLHEKTINYPIGDNEDLNNNTYLTWNVVTGNYEDIRQQLALGILGQVLIDNPGAPLKQALLDAHIGSDIYGGFSDDIRQPYFGITAKNAQTSDNVKFREIIYTTLKKLVSEGLNHQALLGTINHEEFFFRQADYGRLPKGLFYNLLVLQTWLYDDQCPFGYLKRLDEYQWLRQHIDEGYFELLIKELLLDNTHGAILTAVPEKGLTAARNKQTEKQLADLKASLSAQQIDEIVKQTAELTAYQKTKDTPQQAAVIPHLHRQDINPTERKLNNQLTSIEVNGQPVKVLCHPQDTNGIIYLDLMFEASHINPELVSYLGLLTEILSYVDTANYRYQDLYNTINIESGSITTHFDILSAPDNNSYQCNYTVSIKALTSQIESAWALAGEIINNSKFDDAHRLMEIVSQCRSQLEVRLAESGNVVAASRAAAYTSPRQTLNDLTGGIGYYQAIKKIESQMKEDPQPVIDNLKLLVSQLFDVSGAFVNLSCDSTIQPQVLKTTQQLLANCHGSRCQNAFMISPYGQLNEGFRTSGMVQYVATAGHFTSPYTGSLQVLYNMLTMGYLWDNLRVLGGAYGCACRFDRLGNGLFTSYRDPHLHNTLKVYRETVDYLNNFKADESTMTNYIIGTISEVDRPMTPFMFSQWCLVNYLTGITQKELQDNRDQILNTTDQDIRNLAPYIQQIIDTGSICAIGNAEKINSGKDLFNHIEDLI